MSYTHTELAFMESALVATEAAIDLCERALKHDSVIDAISASDAAKSYRSIQHLFNAEESALIFTAALNALKERASQIRIALES